MPSGLNRGRVPGIFRLMILLGLEAVAQEHRRADVNSWPSRRLEDPGNPGLLSDFVGQRIYFRNGNMLCPRGSQPVLDEIDCIEGADETVDVQGICQSTSLSACLQRRNESLLPAGCFTMVSSDGATSLVFNPGGGMSAVCESPTFCDIICVKLPPGAVTTSYAVEATTSPAKTTQTSTSSSSTSTLTASATSTTSETFTSSFTSTRTSTHSTATTTQSTSTTSSLSTSSTFSITATTTGTTSWEVLSANTSTHRNESQTTFTTSFTLWSAAQNDSQASSTASTLWSTQSENASRVTSTTSFTQWSTSPENASQTLTTSHWYPWASQTPSTSQWSTRWSEANSTTFEQWRLDSENESNESNESQITSTTPFLLWSTHPENMSQATFTPSHTYPSNDSEANSTTFPQWRLDSENESNESNESQITSTTPFLLWSTPPENVSHAWNASEANSTTFPLWRLDSENESNESNEITSTRPFQQWSTPLENMSHAWNESEANSTTFPQWRLDSANESNESNESQITSTRPFPQWSTPENVSQTTFASSQTYAWNESKENSTTFPQWRLDSENESNESNESQIASTTPFLLWSTFPENVSQTTLTTPAHQLNESEANSTTLPQWGSLSQNESLSSTDMLSSSLQSDQSESLWSLFRKRDSTGSRTAQAYPKAASELGPMSLRGATVQPTESHDGIG